MNCHQTHCVLISDGKGSRRFPHVLRHLTKIAGNTSNGITRLGLKLFHHAQSLEYVGGDRRTLSAILLQAGKPAGFKHKVKEDARGKIALNSRQSALKQGERKLKGLGELPVCILKQGLMNPPPNQATVTLARSQDNEVVGRKMNQGACQGGEQGL